MAAPKYLKRDATSGKVAEVVATESGSLPATSEVIVSTTSLGTIDPTLLPGTEVHSGTAGESLLAGAFIYVKASDGKIYNATWASGGNQAVGFVLAAYSASDLVKWYDDGDNNALSSLTIGTRYYGDKTTAGAVTATVPTGAGVLHQLLGIAISTTELDFMFQDAIVLAS